MTWFTFFTKMWPNFKMTGKKRKITFQFDIALSYASENRAYVDKVASILTNMGLKIFYDKYDKVGMWGRDIYDYLSAVYSEKARYTVIFISKDYARKNWTNHERKSAQARAIGENVESILPVRFDKTKIPGILPTVGYIDLEGTSPKQLAETIKAKLGMFRRPDFFPQVPDRLFGYLKVVNKKDLERCYVVANSLFSQLKLMTFEERVALSVIARSCCPQGVPENAHMNLSFLARILKSTEDKTVSLFARLDSLNIRTRVFKMQEQHKDETLIKGKRKTIEIKYEPLLVDFAGNATDILIATFDCIYDNLCPSHAKEAIKYLDFSVLSSHTGASEVIS